jgi:hypothetical protein
LKKLLVALGIAALSTGAMAQYTAGSVYQNSSNGHYYQLFTGSATWNAANSFTSSLSYSGYQGHLATVTSQDENNWLLNTFGGAALADKSIGGTQAAGSLTRDSGWSWITGETWSFTLWNFGEPNDNYSPTELGNENALQIAHNNTDGSWNDIPFTSYSPNGFLVEYSAPLNPGNNAVPEPSEWAAMGLLGAGLLGLVVKNRKKNLEAAK